MLAVARSDRVSWARMDRENVLCALDQAQLGRLIDWIGSADEEARDRACFADPATRERLRSFLEARRTRRRGDRQTRFHTTMIGNQGLAES